jgi:TolB-like protein/class 3 adenylate cyclase/Flp pilus assembly protein TadD
VPSSSEASSAEPVRELAAIMFSDIAGYTALMGRDEGKAVRALAAHRELVRSLVRRFNGRTIGDIGDGTLVSFHSALDAVNCAREVQSALADDTQMRVRIGIHVGDVLFSEGRVVGDGVNVASRIHGLAAPGGICISERVYEDVRNKPDIRARDLGERTLKNVDRPIRVYALVLDGAAHMGVAATPANRAQFVRRLAIAAAAVAVVVAGIWLARSNVLRSLIPSTEVRGAPGAPVTLAVLPFANLSGDKNDEYFSDGMTEEIRGDLSEIAGLQVTARTSSFAFKGQNEDVRKIAKLLSVRNVLEGSVRRSTDRVRIEVELIDALNGFTVWSERYDEKLADLFQIQSDVALSVADKLRVSLLPGEKARVERKPTDNLEAYNLYLQGNYYAALTGGSGAGGGAMKAIDSYSAAIAKDPNFALAYVGRADAYGLATFFISPQSEAVPKLKADVEHALALDDKIGVAHALLAFYVCFLYEWDWPAAEREFQIALKLDPDNPINHFYYGYYLSALGRFDDSLRETLRARELDPQGPIWVSSTGDTFFNARRYDQALQYYEQEIAMAPLLSYSHSLRGWTLLKLKGDKAAFVRDEEQAVALLDTPQNQSALAYAYTLVGRFAEARTILREKFEEASKQRYVDPGQFALNYFALGDKDRAFELLDRAYRDRSPIMIHLNLPYSDDMRSDPRFTALVKKVGLPP